MRYPTTTLTLVSLVLMGGAAAAVAEGAVDGAGPGSRAAHFYAAGLETPLLELRNGVLLVRACADRLRRACSKQQRVLAANDRTLTLLDALTLFPQRAALGPAATIRKPAELTERITLTSAGLLRAAGEYDRHLFSRYGATLRACPDEDAALARSSLDELVRLDLGGFQALAGDDLAHAQEEIAREETATVERLMQSSEDCAAARTLGAYLMQLMHSKLQPWSGEDARVANESPSFDFRAPPKARAPEVPTSELAHAVAGNFVLVVATELQVTAFPESAAAIKAIADEAGAGGSSN